MQMMVPILYQSGPSLKLAQGGLLQLLPQTQHRQIRPEIELIPARAMVNGHTTKVNPKARPGLGYKPGTLTPNTS